MNKKYFAKYVPIEGEIKEGDLVNFYANNIGKILGKCTRVNSSKNSIHIKTEEEEKHFPLELSKKVKLFLCSRDIQVGDKFNNSEIPNKEYIADIVSETDIECYKHDCFVPRKYCFKVIGEISSDALEYVKEGDEFDENDLCIRFTNMHGMLISNLFEDFTEDRLRQYNLSLTRIGIKGPCGHFH